MSEPTAEQLEAAIEAISSEAGLWRDMSTQVATMASVADGLTLNAFHFSGLGHLAGMEDVYRDLQQRIAMLLRQGATNMGNTADALKQAADGYQQDEDDAVHRMKNIY